MKKWIVLVTVFFIGFAAKAQYGAGPDRYFYDEEFDWRWDVRVRISDGHRSGYLTNREARRLYNRLEDIERKEWAFQSDGYYSVWEQDEIWYDVVELNRLIGLELTDWDRRYYGYSGVVISGRLPWYFGSTYDFYRFDRRGYGTIHVGYAPRVYYPVRHVYYTKSNNYTTNWNNRSVSSNRSVQSSRVQSSRVATPRANEGSRVSTNRSVESSRTRDYNTPSGRVSSSSDSRRVSTPDRSTSEPNARVNSSARNNERSTGVNNSRSESRNTDMGQRSSGLNNSRSESRSTDSGQRSSGVSRSESNARSSSGTSSSRSSDSGSRSSSRSTENSTSSRGRN